MKAVLKLAIAASLAAGAAAQPHNHHHHHHARKHQHDARDVAVEYAYTTETTYVDAADGSTIDNDQAEEGLADGVYKVVGESTPKTPVPTSYTPTPIPSTTSTSSTTSYKPTTTSSSSSSSTPPATTSSAGGEFLELKLGSKPTTTSKAPATTAASSSSSDSGATGVDADFPDGELDCSTFPSDYGAVWLDNTDVSTGWVGYMDVGLDGYSLGQSAEISVTISEPTSGDVQPGYFVGYACPPGYDAAQWPEAQGSSGQSIGGLFCAADSKLYLTRPESSSKLCQAGAGNVKVVNKMDEDVYICKTWYPGNEGMYLPTHVAAGATVELYNPYQEDSYVWQGSTTSAQYYINRKGVPIDQACTWTPSGEYTDVAGNWAPLNLGTSVNADGQTFLSIFHNTPTSSATLDYNIEISGDDVSGLPCEYDASSDATTGDTNGCTVSTTGGMITVTFSD